MKNASISLSVGRVVIALPYQNHYMINTERGSHTAIDVGTGSGRRGGHIGGGAHLPGASVLLAMIDTQSESSRSMQIPNLIIGSFDPFPSPSAIKDTNGTVTQEGTDFDILAVVENCLSDVNNNQAYLNLLQQNNTLPFLNQDRSKNRPMDTVPGDWYKNTVLGGLILLSEMMTSMGVSPDCRLMFHGLSGETELLTRNLTIDAQSFFQQFAGRGGNPIRVTNWALTPNESLGEGIQAGSMINAEEEANPSKVVPLAEDQAGFFRRMVLEGGGVEGFWDSIKMDLEKPATYTYGKTDGIQGLLSEMKRMDGTYRLSAAREIKLEKTTVIQVPVQTADMNTPQIPPEEEEEESTVYTDSELKQQVFGLTSDEVQRLTPLLAGVFGDLEESQLFFQGLRKDEGIWTFATTDVSDKNTKVRALPPQQMEYTEEEDRKSVV